MFVENIFLTLLGVWFFVVILERGVFEVGMSFFVLLEERYFWEVSFFIGFGFISDWFLRLGIIFC